MPFCICDYFVALQKTALSLRAALVLGTERVWFIYSSSFVYLLSVPVLLHCHNKHKDQKQHSTEKKISFIVCASLRETRVGTDWLFHSHIHSYVSYIN